MITLIYVNLCSFIHSYIRNWESINVQNSLWLSIFHLYSLFLASYLSYSSNSYPTSYSILNLITYLWIWVSVDSYLYNISWLKKCFSHDCIKIFSIVPPTNIDIEAPQMNKIYCRLTWVKGILAWVEQSIIKILLGILSLTPCLLIFIMWLSIIYFCMD